MKPQTARAYYYARTYEDEKGCSWDELTGEQKREWRLEFEQTDPRKLPEIGEDGTGCMVSEQVHLGHDDLIVIPDEPDMVARPPHYTAHPSGVQPITITRHETFCLGNVIKYCMRAKYKGNEIQDLKKAAQYLAWEIERLEGAS